MNNIRGSDVAAKAARAVAHIKDDRKRAKMFAALVKTLKPLEAIKAEKGRTLW